MWRPASSPSELVRVPYATVEDLRSSQFFAAAVSGSPPRPDRLLRVLRLASQWADQSCNQRLAADLRVLTGMGWTVEAPDGSAYLPVNVGGRPCLAVLDVKVGPTFGSLASVPVESGWLDDVVFRVPVGFAPRTRFAWEVRAVTGFPHTMLTVAAGVGDTTLEVAGTAGMFEGTPLMVGAGESVQLVTVTGTGTGTVDVTPGLVDAQPVGAQVTGMPEVVREAVCLVAAAMLKGSMAKGAVALDRRAQQRGFEQDQSASADFQLAAELLAPWRLSTL